MIQKIRNDLSITQTNMTILSDMMTELAPGREHPEDRSLLSQESEGHLLKKKRTPKKILAPLEQLHGTCRAMQSRLVELIGQVDDDKLTADLLEINDNMNNLFLRYERFEKNQVQVKHGSSQGAIKKTPVPGGTPVTSSASKSLMDAPLIDFSSSSSTAAAAASEAPQSFTQVPSMAHFPDEDAENLAEWIGDKNIETEGATSSEFDQFLAERAAAGDTPRK